MRDLEFLKAGYEQLTAKCCCKQVLSQSQEITEIYVITEPHLRGGRKKKTQPPSGIKTKNRIKQRVLRRAG